ncbi:MAG: hypothetical protein ACJAVM_001677 [Sulfitobacter sp.]
MYRPNEDKGAHHMSFFRPEAQAQVWRWREVIVAVFVVALGGWLISGPGLLLAIPGYALVCGGAALAWLGVQRARFRGADGGAGAVQVDEGQVSYFGPLTGGVVALRELDSLSLDGAMFPAHWRLTQSGVPPLLIPVNAAGAEALFDAFATLPGLRTERMLSLLKANSHQSVVIWQRHPVKQKPQLLH